MKTYSVEYTRQALKALEKLSADIKERIVDWIEKNLVDCENPRLYGKALHGQLKGKWRYRVGDYRIVAKIEDDKILIMILDVDSRQQIYR